MAFLKLVDGAVAVYPYSLAQLRRDNPHVSFPRIPSADILASWGVYHVVPVSRPPRDDTKNVVEGTPALISGVWTQVWEVTDASPAQIAERADLQARIVRTDRDQRLRDTDWRALSDTTLTPAWAAYRQALRDVTDQAGFPYDVSWPTPPE